MEPMPDTPTEFESGASPPLQLGGETDAVSPDESPPEETPAPIPSPVNKEEFEERVQRLCAMMKAEGGDELRDRILAEIYVNIASAEMGIRGMFETFQQQGMAGFMRGAFKRG